MGAASSAPTVVQQHHHSCDLHNPPDVEYQGCSCPNGWPRWIGTDGNRTVVGRKACDRLIRAYRKSREDK